MAIAIAALFLICCLGFAIAGGKTWQWWHVALLVFVILAAAGFVSLTAIALKTHAQWGKVYSDLKKQLETEQATLTALKIPSLAAPGASLPELRAELGRTILDRGRVWRGVTPVGIDGETITLNTAAWGDEQCAQLGVQASDDELGGEEVEPLEPLEGEAAAPAPVAPVAVKAHGIETGTVLIAFLQVPLAELTEAQRKALFRGSNLPERDTKNVCHVPAFLLGDFKVTATTADTVSLQPVTRLDEAQIEAITGSIGKNWALYELMPIDRHDVFAGSPENHLEATPGEEPVAVEADADASADVLAADEEAVEMDDASMDETSVGSGAPLRFQGFTEAELRALLPQQAMGLADDDYAALLAEYVRDQRPAGSNGSDPKERLLKKVRFLQEHTVEVDVTQAEPGVERGFDPTGRAQLPHLRHGEPVVFQKDAISDYMDAEAADALIRAGIAQDVEDTPAIYDRQLRDYLFTFRENEFQMSQLDQQIAVIQEDQQKMLETAEKARQQIAYRTQEREKLTQDQDGFARELAIVQQYRKELEQKRDAMRQELSQLYRTNRELLNRLPSASTRSSGTSRTATVVVVPTNR